MTATIPGVLKRALEVTLEKRGTVTISPSQHVATGGEGSIYKPSSGTIIKLYSDENRMTSEGLVDKIKLLSSLSHPYIVSPKGLVFKGKKPIGFYMPYVHGEPLARVFTTTFRQRERFTDKDALALVDGMRTAVMEAHAKNAVLVDANEFNWLVIRSPKVEPRVIDVDSWSIGSWKPSVIMPSIRDLHTHGFTEASDWFSYAVVSFQVFTGIHPYKGMLPGYKPNDMETRMRDKKSVFTPGIRLNSAVRDFGCIPKKLLDWYEAVFQGSERGVPPSALHAQVAQRIQKQQTVTSSNTLAFSLLYENTADEPMIIFPCGVVQLASGTLINLANGKIIAKVTRKCEVIAVDNGFLIAEESQSGYVFKLATTNGVLIDIPVQFSTHTIVRYRDRLFVVIGTTLQEIALKDFGKPLVVMVRNWQILPNATTWYDGLGILDSLGAKYLVLPFGDSALTTLHIPELDGYRVVEAIAGMRHVMITAVERKTGQNYQFDLAFDKEYVSYRLQQNATDTAEIHAVLLPKGVCAQIKEDHQLILMVPINSDSRIVDDQQINASFMLANWDNRVLVLHNKKIWTMTLKNP